MTETDTRPASVTLLRCGYTAPCGASKCRTGATTIARKAEASGRFLRQIELCDAHASAVAARERARGLAIIDRR